MGFPFDIVSSLSWPYRKENIISAVVIPGAIELAYFVVLLGFVGILVAIALAMGPDTTTLLLLIPLGLISLLISVCLWMPIAGYRWEILHVVHEQGVDASAPPWQNRWLGYLWNGFKACGFYLVLQIALSVIQYGLMFGVLLVLTLGLEGDPPEIVSDLISLALSLCTLLLVPYLWTPYLIEAKEKRFLHMFNVLRVLEVGSAHYWKLMLWGVLYIVISLLYLIPIMFSLLLIVGPFFVAAALNATHVHLFAQAYSGSSTLPPEHTGSPSRPT